MDQTKIILLKKRYAERLEFFLNKLCSCFIKVFFNGFFWRWAYFQWKWLVGSWRMDMDMDMDMELASNLKRQGIPKWFTLDEKFIILPQNRKKYNLAHIIRYRFHSGKPSAKKLKSQAFIRILTIWVVKFTVPLKAYIGRVRVLGYFLRVFGVLYF